MLSHPREHLPPLYGSRWVLVIPTAEGSLLPNTSQISRCTSPAIISSGLSQPPTAPGTDNIPSVTDCLHLPSHAGASPKQRTTNYQEVQRKKKKRGEKKVSTKQVKTRHCHNQQQAAAFPQQHKDERICREVRQQWIYTDRHRGHPPWCVQEHRCLQGWLFPHHISPGDPS